MPDDKPQKINIGFVGSQVLSARVAPGELTRLRNALGVRRLARAHRRGRDGRARPDQGRVRARRPRGSPGRFRDLSGGLLAPLLKLDRRTLLLLRTRGHDPRVERAVAAYSRAGEHAACWLVLGLAGAAGGPRTGRRRRRWRRGLRVVAASYVVNYAVKVTIRRRRPELPGLPPLTGTVSGLSLPSAHATSSFAAARAFRGLLPAGLLYGAAAAFAVSRPYLGVHYPSDVLAGAALGTAVASAWPDVHPRGAEHDEGRDRRDAQRGQVFAVPRADRGGGGGGQLPVHHDRAEHRGGPRTRRAPRCGRGDGQGLEPGPGHDRVPRHRGAGRRGSQGRGSRQPVPGQHPGDRRDRPRRARPQGSGRRASRGPSRSDGGHRDDRDRADLCRPRAGRAPA